MRRSVSLPMMAVLVLLVAGTASAQLNLEPKVFEEVGITERLNVQVPLDLTFTDENGRTVALGEYFQPGRPVILTLNYYACPMLCTVQLNELVRGLKDMPWTPGKEFEIITVSFDPRETHTLARLKKQNYLKEYGRPEGAAGWHFLTGRKDNITTLTETVGFTYRWDAESEQYAHGAAAIILTPDGRTSRYIKSIVYDPSTLRLALMEAKEGKYRSTMEEVLLFCFHYDAEAGRYTLAATNIMRAGATLTLLILGTYLVTTWVRSRHSRQPAAPTDTIDRK